MSTMQEALLAEFEYIMRRALADEEAPDFRVTGAVLFEGMLRPTWEGVPEGCKPRSAPNVWRPDRPTLVELAARTIMLRSRRWDAAAGAVVPWTSNLDEAFRKHWRARFHIGLEVDRGWFDLIARRRLT